MSSSTSNDCAHPIEAGLDCAPSSCQRNLLACRSSNQSAAFEATFRNRLSSTFGQAPATFGKIGIGGSYGESHLSYANAADRLANPTLLDTNSSWVGQVRYGLTSRVTLIGEYTATKAKAHNGNDANGDDVARRNPVLLSLAGMAGDSMNSQEPAAVMWRSPVRL